MADEYEVIDVGEMHPTPERPCWYVTMRKPDGTLHEHFFPKETLEWRAAEYGLTDPTEILDVILHARLRPRMVRDDHVSLVNPAKGPTAATPVTLWTAKSTREARDAHRQAIAVAKETKRVVDPSGHLARILGRHGMTASGVREKRERVDVTRWIKLYGGLPVEPITEEATRA